MVALCSWQSAAGWIDHDESAESYNNDEDERARLWVQLTETMTEQELLARLAAVVAAAARAIRMEATLAAARERESDASRIDAATAAALLCLHQHTLAQWAGAGDGHALTRKYALFVCGRWPLGFHAVRYGLY